MREQDTIDEELSFREKKWTGNPQTSWRTAFNYPAWTFRRAQATLHLEARPKPSIPPVRLVAEEGVEVEAGVPTREVQSKIANRQAGGAAEEEALKLVADEVEETVTAEAIGADGYQTRARRP